MTQQYSKAVHTSGNESRQQANPPGANMRRMRQQAARYMLRSVTNALESDRALNPIERRALLRLLRSIAEGSDVRSQLGIINRPKSRKRGAPAWTVDLHLAIAMSLYLKRRCLGRWEYGRLILGKEESAARETATTWGVSVTTVRKAARQHRPAAHAWATKRTVPPEEIRLLERFRQLYGVAYGDALSKPTELDRLLEMNPDSSEWEAQMQRVIRDPGRLSALTQDERDWLTPD